MENSRNTRKEVIGRVSSNKADKTITVTIDRKERHPLYGKYVPRKTVLKADDRQNRCQIGDQVKIMETRPLSKTKRWRLVEIVKPVNNPS